MRKLSLGAWQATGMDEGFLKLVAVAFLLLGAIFGFMQPAGSLPLGRTGAMLFWMLHAVAAVPCLAAAVTALGRTRLGCRLPPLAFVVLSGLIAALFLSLAALALEAAFGVQEVGPDGGLIPASWGFAGLWIDEIGGVAPPFLLAWVLVNLPRLMRLDGGAAAVMAGPGEARTSEGPEVLGVQGFLARLPAALGTDVVLLKSDLHYLHVHTPKGRAMLLFNLGDAEAELGDAGVRVHRSHWVADRHVLRLRRTASGMVVVLSGGLEAPVSRRRQKEVVTRYGQDTAYHPLSGPRHGGGQFPTQPANVCRPKNDG